MAGRGEGYIEWVDGQMGRGTDTLFLRTALAWHKSVS